MIDNMVPGISTVITGAMLRFIRSTISRKTSGAKVFSDRLNAIHGPWNIPVVRAEKTMLINCHVFIVRFHLLRGSVVALGSALESISTFLGSTAERVNGGFH